MITSEGDAMKKFIFLLITSVFVTHCKGMRSKIEVPVEAGGPSSAIRADEGDNEA